MTIEQTPRLATGAAIALAFLLSTCSGPAQVAADRPQHSGNPDDVVAEADGIKITRAELDKKAADRLAALRQQEYDIRRQALDDIILDRLLEKEAKARGMTKEKYLATEVEGKVAPPSPDEVDALYKQYKPRLGGRTREEAGPEIERAIRARAVSEKQQILRRDLLDRARVTIRLTPPRVVVPVPGTAPALGPEGAPVTIVEFSDYQCPYCRRAEGTVEQVLTRYSGKVRFVHRDFPLDGHPRAFPTARAARCAGEQGKFWDYHKGVFNKPGDLSDEDLKKRAADLGLDATTFGTCVAGKGHDPVIQASLDDGARLGITGTPTYFINGRMLVGARPIDQFVAIIDDELSAGR